MYKAISTDEAILEFEDYYFSLARNYAGLAYDLEAVLL